MRNALTTYLDPEPDPEKKILDDLRIQFAVGRKLLEQTRNLERERGGKWEQAQSRLELHQVRTDKLLAQLSPAGRALARRMASEP